MKKKMVLNVQFRRKKMLLISNISYFVIFIPYHNVSFGYNIK